LLFGNHGVSSLLSTFRTGARLRLMEQVHGKGDCNKMTLLSL
jgi:hypothetical protein